MMALHGPATAAGSVGSSSRFNTPLQQQNHQQQQQQQQMTQGSQQQHSSSGSRQSRSGHVSSQSHSTGSGHGLQGHAASSSTSQNMKALQAKQRQELLAHAAIFLNQQSAPASASKNNKPTSSAEKVDNAQTEVASNTESEQKKEEKGEN